MMMKKTLNFLKMNKFFVKPLPSKFFCENIAENVPRFKTNLSNDVATAKKQVFWRIRNIGQKELEYIIMKWYDKQNLSYDEMKKFSEEVLEMENPDMNNYFVKMDPAPENLEFTRRIQHFIENQ
jgi:succinate dehydrogenase flavin-adding protein (antitoxin of CptAB toxin-antitoxin module)